MGFLDTSSKKGLSRVWDSVPRSSHSDLFLDFGSLADSAAQIVELCASDFTDTDDLDLFHVRGMDREGLFRADAVGNTPYGEGFGNAAVLLRDNGTFEDLGPDSGSFNYSLLYLYGSADVELRNLLFQLLFCKSFKHIQSVLPPYFFGVHASDRGPPSFNN